MCMETQNMQIESLKIETESLGFKSSAISRGGDEKRSGYVHYVQAI